MAEIQQNNDSFFAEISMRFRDMEEKQKMLRERILLIGQNLIETKEKTRAKELCL